MAEKLMYAASETNADSFYFGKFFAPDPFVAFTAGGKRMALLNALEIGRGRRESIFDEVLSVEEWRERAGKEGKPAGISESIVLLAKEFGMEKFDVAAEFPCGLARKLEDCGLKLSISPGTLFPEREIETREEAEAIREGNRASAAGIRAAEELLKRATIRDGKIFYEERVLTSERL